MWRRGDGDSDADNDDLSGGGHAWSEQGMGYFSALQQMRDVMHIGGHNRSGAQRYRNRDDVAIDNGGGLRDRKQCPDTPGALFVEFREAVNRAE